jgi:hypothetical protein
MRPPTASSSRRAAHSTEPLHKQENQTFRPHYVNRVTHQASKARPIELTRRNSNVKSLISVSPPFPPPPLRHHLVPFSPLFFTVYISRAWVFCLFGKFFLSPLRIRFCLVFLVGWKIKFVSRRGAQSRSELGVLLTLNNIVNRSCTFEIVNIYILILGVCILLRVWDPGEGGLFRLRNVTIEGFLLYIIT